MSAVSSCPCCAKQISIPGGVQPSEMVRCPLCQAEFPLQEALVGVPPMLVIVSALAEADKPAAGAAALHLFPQDNSQLLVVGEERPELDLELAEFTAPAESSEPLSALGLHDDTPGEDISLADLDEPAPAVAEEFLELPGDETAHAPEPSFDELLFNAEEETEATASDSISLPFEDEAAGFDLPATEDESEPLAFEPSTDEEPLILAEAEDAVVAEAAEDDVLELSEAEIKPSRRKSPRKSSSIINLIFLVSSLPVAAILAFFILLWGFGRDPMGLSGYLPQILKPAAFKQKQISMNNPQVNVPPVPATNPDPAQTPEAPPEPASIPAGPPIPSTNEPQVEAAVSPVAPATPPKESVDTPPLESTPEEALPADSAEEAPAEEEVAEDEPVEEEIVDEQATDDSLDPLPAEDETIKEESPEIPEEEAADPEPAADATDPIEEPAMEEDTPTDPVAEEAPATIEEATDDLIAEPTEEVEPTEDDAKLTSLEEEKEEAKHPVYTGVQKIAIVGPLQRPQYSLDDLQQALADVQAADKALSAGGKSGEETKKLRGQFFRKLYQLAEVITFVDNVNNPQLAKDKASAQKTIETATALPDRFSKAGKAAAQWLKVSKGNEPTGVVLTGSVQSVAQVGGVFETRVLLTDGSTEVSVLGIEAPTVAKQDQVVVAGSIVDKPAEKIGGYTGKEPTAVWSGLTRKAN